ncbi:MAG TPA: hypothetical protein VLB79_12805 [Solirubrobacterales bacterium]|nr:hypothetical protein [Solirubrobacterales bacterium]
MREFRRSARFGLIGVFVVAAIVVVIALSADSTDPNPKLQLGLIFGVIAAFLAVLLLLQRGDIDRAAAGDTRGFGEGRRPVDDPTKLEDGELWSALAVRPIDTDAIRARREMWDVGRRGIGLAAVISVLIFLTVPAIYLTESFVPLLIGGPLIAIAAGYGAIRAIGPRGDVDQGYERLDRVMKPLGLSLEERPQVRMVPRSPTMPGFSARLVGPTVMIGQRHGRRVEVRQEQGQSEVTVRASAPTFEAKARDGRLVAKEAASNAEAVLRSVPASGRWKGVEVRGDGEGIVVDRKGDPGAWLCDLWLAERLADEL